MTVSVILVISAAIKLLTQLASTSTYGQLIYLLRDLLERITIFAVLVMFEIFCFAIVAIMFNAEQADNTIGVNLSELFRAFFYGEYASNNVALYSLQIVFTIVQILMFLMLIVYLLSGT